MHFTKPLKSQPKTSPKVSNTLPSSLLSLMHPANGRNNSLGSTRSHGPWRMAQPLCRIWSLGKDHSHWWQCCQDLWCRRGISRGSQPDPAGCPEERSSSESPTTLSQTQHKVEALSLHLRSHSSFPPTCNWNSAKTISWKTQRSRRAFPFSLGLGTVFFPFHLGKRN